MPKKHHKIQVFDLTDDKQQQFGLTHITRVGRYPRLNTLSIKQVYFIFIEDASLSEQKFTELLREFNLQKIGQKEQ